MSATTDTLSAFINKLPDIIIACGTLYGAVQAARANRNSKNTKTLVNGRMTELLDKHGQVAYMQGIADANQCPLLSGKSPQGCTVCAISGRCTLQDKLVQISVPVSTTDKEGSPK